MLLRNRLSAACSVMRATIPPGNALSIPEEMQFWPEEVSRYLLFLPFCLSLSYALSNFSSGRV
jgi:hypothetical protein